MGDWDPETFLDVMRAEVPDYELLQDKLVDATRDREVEAILELGTGSGETARRVLRVHPGARLYGIDASEAMLAAARRALVRHDVELQVGRLEDPLPDMEFDLVIAALSVHHLEGAGKADLFHRVARVLRSGGRFVLADVVVPDDPADAVIPIEDGYDFPSRVDEQLHWMEQAGFRATVFWRRRDLAVLVGDLEDPRDP